MRSLYETRFVFGENDGLYHQSTRLKEQPYAALADERFRTPFTAAHHPRNNRALSARPRSHNRGGKSKPIGNNPV